MSAFVRRITALPLTAVRLAFRLVWRLQRGPAPSFFLPVAGVTQERAHSVMFGLREAARLLEADEELCAYEWLAAVATQQTALDRLQIMLSHVEDDLSFWRARLDSPRHGLFLLIGQGPVRFGRDILALVPHKGRLAARKQRRRLSSTERIEQRVTILRSLQHHLAAALGEVNSASGGLHLRQPSPIASAQDAPSSQAAKSSAKPDAVLSAARSAIVASLDTTTQAFEGLRPLQHQLNSHPESLALLPSQAMLVSPSWRQLEGSGTDDGSSSRAPTPARNNSIAGSEVSIEKSEGAEGASEGIKGSSGSAPDLDGARSPDGAAVAAALRRAQAAIGADPRVVPGMTFTDAMRRANNAAYRQGLVVKVPLGLKAPSKYQQRWLQYVLASALTGYAALFVYRHSRLSGSRDLEVWVSQAATGLQSTYRENVLGPLAQLRNELFKTFRARRSIVSELEYENDRESLRRMLLDFRTDYLSKHGGPPPSGAQAAAAAAHDSDSSSSSSSAAAVREGAAIEAAAVADDDAGSADMAFMMKAYEAELKRPIRSAVTGQLPRTLLIQVQKLKLDTESAMLQMDQLLKANELNLALIAAVPAFLVGGGALWLLVRWIRPAPVDPKYEALPCRMAMVALERRLQAAEESATTSNIGLVTHAVAKMYTEAHVLYARHSFGGSGNNEWSALRQDLTELAGPGPLTQKMRLSERMSRVYSIFQF